MTVTAGGRMPRPEIVSSRPSAGGRACHELSAATAEVIRRFPGRPEAAQAARDLCRSVLAGHPVGDVADLVVTELVANAVAYTRSGLPGGTVTVSVQCRADGVLIRVTDQGGPGAPALIAAAPGAEHGRGLAL